MSGAERLRETGALALGRGAPRADSFRPGDASPLPPPPVVAAGELPGLSAAAGVAPSSSSDTLLRRVHMRNNLPRPWRPVKLPDLERRRGRDATPAATKSSTGVYYVDVTLNEVGVHTIKFQGDEGVIAASIVELEVQPSVFD